jgi:hypothetical protein
VRAVRRHEGYTRTDGCGVFGDGQGRARSARRLRGIVGQPEEHEDMRSSIRSCGTATLLVSTLGVAMGDTWDSYVPRTIRSVIEANQAEVAVESTYVFTANNFATRANVV